MLKQLEASLQPYVDNLMSKDKDFAHDYEESPKTLTDFVELLYQNAYDAAIKNGRVSCCVGALPTDEEVEGKLIHYFHETAVGNEVKDLGFNMAVEKIDKSKAAPAAPSEPVGNATGTETAPSAPSEPAPVGNATGTETETEDDDDFDPFA